jgi:F-type H+-transporting ATPase subunit delta
VAESITIARPYTKAVFETALIQGNLSSWSEFLNLAAAVVTDADIKQRWITLLWPMPKKHN